MGISPPKIPDLVEISTSQRTGRCLNLIAANFVWAGSGGKNPTPYSQWASTQLTYPKYATGHLAAVR